MNGSRIAKNGFKNEHDIVNKFNNWQHDAEAKEWLEVLGHDPAEVTAVQAIKMRGPDKEIKPDIQVKVQTGTSGNRQHNISIKLVSNPRGSNHVDKRWVDAYAQMWNIPANLAAWLKEFTGETKPAIQGRSKKRKYLNERPKHEQITVINFFNHNKQAIVSDVLKGTKPFAADWMMVAQKLSSNNRWIILPMDAALEHFGFGAAIITPMGGLRVGRVRVQRKGGDGGKPTANKLQFKINPAELFDL